MPKGKTKKSGLIVAIVVGQTTESMAEAGTTDIKSIRSLPVYSAVLPKYTLVAEEDARLNTQRVKLRVKAYPPDNYLVEAELPVADIFDRRVHDTRERLIALAERRLRKLPVIADFKEEYTVYAVADYRGDAKQFDFARQTIVGLIRSERRDLSVAEITATIADASLRYEPRDLAIVEWDGAFIFDPNGDWQETIAVLEIANIHLLRLRVLDRVLDRRLEAIARVLSSIGAKRRTEGSLRKQMDALLRIQTRSIAEFSHSGRDIQLVGDWYAAKVYQLIGRKLHLEEWRTNLRNELDNLRDLYQTAAEHYGISAQTRADTIQIIMWFVLLVGWGVIMVYDLYGAFAK